MIKRLTSDELASIMEIETSCLQNPYTQEQFAYELSDNPCAFIYGYYVEDKLVGLIDYWITFDCVQLCKIAVLKDYRKQGIGHKLMEFMYEQAKKEGCEHVLLEVRKSNEVAQAFYEKQDFLVINERKNYYDNPREDALVMGKILVGV